eukprot:gnl/MRDRNA2_/MRDRNA2_241357_c0_seq1.p1 gnl/MRDRNA2_/MRDRNA2_241357_c0~~gnl/MRDRNA2_/MRDRNA2_241357_c0_seq1.p1  ORF type:complete len:305 (-),score=40.80 gnl/MRDRNA2_/MRDRNA2_241357_c0_seq1:47-961(-)
MLGGRCVHSSPGDPVGDLKCVRKLQEVAGTCRAEGITSFSITGFQCCAPQYLAPQDRQEFHPARMDTWPANEDINIARKHPVNLQYPKLKILSAEHGLFLIDDFVSRDVCGALSAGIGSSVGSKGQIQVPDLPAIPLAPTPGTCAKLQNDAYFGGRGSSRCKVRNSHQWCARDFGSRGEDAERQFVQHVEKLIEIPRSHWEPAALTRYLAGGYYDHHVDGRRGTVLLYTTDETEGGATYFPHLDLRIPPKAGRLIVFFGQDETGGTVEQLRHMSEELISGEKWVSQIWIHDKPFHADPAKYITC